jgi:hypothetical protein
VLDELYALFSADDTVAGPTTEDDTDPETDEVCCCLSADSTMVSGVKTLQFQGQFQQLPVLIMLDSGSSSSFISTQLVSRLSLMTDPCQTVSVRVANGDIMHCSSFLSGAAWSFHHYQFQHDLKVLPLTSYDIILGMDWLQLFSPMKVDWHQQWLAIPYKGTTVWLYSISDTGDGESAELLVQLFSVPVTHEHQDTDLPPAISTLLTEFPEVLSPPDSLPPKREYDHEIPLVEGARPVTVKPYRYPPALKDEIETQVDAMLQQGII